MAVWTKTQFHNNYDQRNYPNVDAFFHAFLPIFKREMMFNVARKIDFKTIVVICIRTNSYVKNGSKISITWYLIPYLHKLSLPKDDKT